MKKLLIPPVFVLITLILIVTFYFILPRYNVIPFPWNLGGALIAFAGFVIMGKARELFSKNKTTLTFNKSDHLITDGVCAGTRNPMYLGMFILLLGLGICFMNIFSVITPFGFMAAIHLVIIPGEEKKMFETFGQSYLDYKKSVRRWM